MHRVKFRVSEAEIVVRSDGRCLGEMHDAVTSETGSNLWRKGERDGR